MENVSDPTKRLKSILTSLQKSVECPICLETVKTPFKLCVKGHVVCLGCMKKLEKCPLCQEPFTLENPVCMKNILESLPHLCRYSDDGCEEIVEPENDHEDFCGYRPIMCRVGYCSDKVSVNKLLEHYEEQHPIVWFQLVSRPESGTQLWRVNPTSTEHTYSPHWLFTNWFWVLLINDVTKKDITISFQATPIGKLEQDYYACIKFEKDKFSYSYTLKASVLSSREDKFDGKEDYSINQDKSSSLEYRYCMRIPRQELSNLTDNEGYLTFSYTFFQK